MRFGAVFREEQAVQLTGLSRQTLGRWRRLGIFAPAFDLRGQGGPLDWIYNTADVLMLRTLAVLRHDHGLTLEALRPVAAWFTRIDDEDEERDEAWERRLWVMDGRVLFEASDADEDPAGRAAVIDLGALSAEIGRAWDVMRQRDPETIGKVSRNRYINRNAWTVAGTRVMTRSIREFADAGYGVPEIIEQYPVLTPADVAAALEHERGLLVIQAPYVSRQQFARSVG